MKSFPHLGAFESTKIYGSGFDNLDTTRHIEFWESDLSRLAESGIDQLRYPVPWHRIESQAGTFDWNWIDRPMRLMQDLGLKPILDPLHHVSLPGWLPDGFANPAFPEYYVSFVQQVARRYEWVERYTIFNEPLPTLVLCALTGDWFPYRRSDRDFVIMGVHVSRAICLASANLRKLNPKIELVQVDSCEHHTARDARSKPWVDFVNERRFLFHDLVQGNIQTGHPVLPFLKANGFTEDDRLWFSDHAAKIDIIGLDYYAHSEIDWAWSSVEGRATLRFPCASPRGFAAVAGDYVRRFRTPVLLSETNIGGTVTDRITWLKFMEEQAETLASVADFRGFCWFPSVDATDWDSLCTVANGNVSPMGIWSLAADRNARLSSELSDLYVGLARGEISSKDLPAYRFNAPLDRDLAGFRPLMEHWNYL